jgi:hypothetical protein
MEAYKALEVIEKLERDLCAMYDRLRVLVKDDKDLYDLFDELCTEEESHATMAGMLKRIVKSKPEDFKDISLNFTEIRKTMDHIEVVRAIPREKIGEILLQCYLIESNLVEEYVVSALKESNEEVRQLLEALGQGLRDHLAKIASRVQERGKDITDLDTIRRHPRISFSDKITINGKIAARGVDISESGMFLQVTIAFADGASVEVAFQISGGTVTATGTVTYSVPNAGFGLVFRDLSDKDRMLIREYVDKALKRIDRVGTSEGQA